MVNHKLHIGEFEETDYEIIAIHTLLEDYRLAYYINQKLPVNFKKCSQDIYIQINKDVSSFSRFIYEDENNDVFWNLLENKNEIEITQNTALKSDLFSNPENSFTSTAYLLSDFKKVDFILKIENIHSLEIHSVIENLKKIEQINMIYSIDKNKIKAKNNLIF